MSQPNVYKIPVPIRLYDHVLQLDGSDCRADILQIHLKKLHSCFFFAAGLWTEELISILLVVTKSRN